MATIRTSGGQTFDVTQSYEDLIKVKNSGWTGTIMVNDTSTNVQFTISIPQITAIQP